MKPTLKPFVVALSTLLLTAGAVAHGDDQAEDAVAYRQGVYNVIAWNFGPMVGMVKREIPFDAEVFARNAQRLAMMTPLAQEGFIPDSITDDSTATPDIWERWDEFKAGLAKLNDEATKLAELASSGTDMAAIGKQVGAVGQACKGCHDEFRSE